MMDFFLVVLAVVIWKALGFAAGVLMVTRWEWRDFVPSDITFALWMGFGGPISLAIYFASSAIHDNKDRVLFKAKQRNEDAARGREQQNSAEE